MGKSNRLITLDYETNEKLKGIENASGLIAELLYSHFNAHLSNDLEFLEKQIQEIDIKIKNLEFTRDSIIERINIINQRTDKNKKIMEEQAKLQDKTKILSKWLSNKIRENIITFEEMRNIKAMSNWEDCVESIISDKLDLKELVETANKLENNLEGGKNNNDK